jgi:hypothetical protein
MAIHLWHFGQRETRNLGIQEDGMSSMPESTTIWGWSSHIISSPFVVILKFCRWFWAVYHDKTWQNQPENSLSCPASTQSEADYKERQQFALSMHLTFHWGNSKLSELLHVCHVWVVRTPAMRRAHVGGPQCKTWDSTGGDREARTRNPFMSPECACRCHSRRICSRFPGFWVWHTSPRWPRGISCRRCSRDTKLWTAKATERHDKATSAASKSGWVLVQFYWLLHEFPITWQ